MNSNTPSFQILPIEEVRKIYKSTYKHLYLEAESFYQAYADKTHLPYTQKVMKQLTRLALFCNRFNIDSSDILDEIHSFTTEQQLQEHIDFLKEYFLDGYQPLRQLEKEGIERRKTRLTVLPELFQKTSRIYVKTQALHSEYKVVQETLHWFNTFLPQDEEFSLQQVDKEVSQKEGGGRAQTRLIRQYLLQEKKQTYKTGHFLKSTAEQIGILNKALEEAPETTRLAFLDFLRQTADYYTSAKNSFSTFRKEHHLPPCQLNAVLFYQLKKIVCLLDKSNTATDFSFQLETLRNDYASRALLIHEMQIKQLQSGKETNDIDLLIFSVRPVDLSNMSTFTDWESCMRVGGSHYEDISKQIGAGSIIVYGVNSQNPNKKLARLLLRPYVTQEELTINRFDRLAAQEATQNPSKITASKKQNPRNKRSVQRIYIPSKIYGLLIPAFKKTVTAFAQKYLNAPLTHGKVFPADSFYLDKLEKNYDVSTLLTQNPLIAFLNNSDIAFKNSGNGKLCIDDINLENSPHINPTGLIARSLTVQAKALSHIGLAGVCAQKLTILNTEELSSFPKNVHPQKELIMNRCCFESLPTHLKLEKLDISQSQKLTQLPTSLEVDEVNADKTNITLIHENIKIKQLKISQTPVQIIHYSPYIERIVVSQAVPFIHPHLPDSVFIGMTQEQIQSAKENYQKQNKLSLKTVGQLPYQSHTR